MPKERARTMALFLLRSTASVSMVCVVLSFWATNITIQKTTQKSEMNSVWFLIAYSVCVISPIRLSPISVSSLFYDIGSFLTDIGEQHAYIVMHENPRIRPVCPTHVTWSARPYRP